MNKILNLTTLSFMWLVSLTLSVTLLGGCGPGDDKTYTGAVSTLATGLSTPFGITMQGGNLYVTNKGNHTVASIAIASSGVVTIAGSGTSGVADGAGTLAGFSFPSGITTDGTYLYVADTNNNKIRKISITPPVVQTLTATGFNLPSGIVWVDNNLYVADSASNTIRLIDASGVVSTFAGAGTGGFIDGVSSVASFNNPSGIATDGFNLYVADTGNHAIRQIAISGVNVTTIAGAPPPTPPASGAVDGPSTNARFKSPVGLVKSGANLYVADRDNHTIRKINILTYEVTTLAGAAGSPGSANGTGADARFSSPQGITTDGVSLYVTDTGNNAIRKIE